MNIKLLLLFAATEMIVSITPGPAVLLVISQGMKRGAKASLRGTLGIEFCNVLFFLLSALGLGALLVASTRLFQIIRWLGVAYLICTGFKMLFVKSHSFAVDASTVIGKHSVALFSQGFITQLVNPRALLYFTALLPQFISTNGATTQQFIVLGVISVLVEIPVLAGYGWLGAQGGRLLPRRFSALPERVAGAFLIGAGAGLAVLKKA